MSRETAANSISPALAFAMCIRERPIGGSPISISTEYFSGPSIFTPRSPTTQWQSSTTFEHLKNAAHLIEVRVGQGRNAAATDLYVDVDAFVTLDPPPRGRPTLEDFKGRLMTLHRRG